MLRHMSQWDRDVRMSHFEMRDYSCRDESCPGYREPVGIQMEEYMGQTLIVGDRECVYCGAEMEIE